MRACGLVGSPIRDGNVDLLVSEVLRGAESQGAEVFKIYLNELVIKPCQSCGVDPRPGFCIIEDGMNEVYKALETCKIVVLGSPVYFDSVSAQTKLMVDRCNCVTPYVRNVVGNAEFEDRQLMRKKGVFVSVAGTQQDFEPLLPLVKGFFSWVNAELVETILHSHDDVELGSVRNDEAMKKKAYDAGARVVRALWSERNS
jgi:multimeric flavodoxin WrbA